MRPVSSRWPVTLGYMQKPRNPRLRNYKHRGVDFGCPKGTPVVATTTGIVIYTGWGGYGKDYGLQVIVRTGDVWHSYSHLSAEQVSIGQVVREGSRLGLSGNTGNVTGDHLHYQENTKPPGWYGNGKYAYQTDRPPRFIDAAGSPSGADTIFDLSFWAQAYAPWFGKAWAPRSAGIIRELRGNEPGTEGSVHVLTEMYTSEQIRTIQQALGSDFARANRAKEKGGPSGLEIFYNDDGPWDAERTPAVGYMSPVARRGAFVQHLERPSTGGHIAIVAAHGPIKAEGGDVAKVRYGRWLAELIEDIDGPVAIAVDVNVPVGSGRSPLKELRAMGFRTFKEQAAIANETGYELPEKKSDYSTILTIPAEARITGGEQSNSSLALSDHRRIEARIVIPA